MKNQKHLLSFSQFIAESNEENYATFEEHALAEMKKFQKFLVENDFIKESEIYSFSQSLVGAINENSEEYDAEIHEDWKKLSEEIDSWTVEMGYEITEDSDAERKEDLEYARRTGERSTGKKLVNLIGWVSFPGISIMRAIFFGIRKKMQIKQMLKRESDPIKKQKLKNELKSMTWRQVKKYKELENMKDKRKKEIEDAKEEGKVKDMGDDEKKKMLVKAETNKKEFDMLKKAVEDEKEKAKEDKKK